MLGPLLFLALASAQEIRQQDIADDGTKPVERGRFTEYTLIYGGAVQVGAELRIARPYRVLGATKLIDDDAAVHTGEVFFDSLFDPVSSDRMLLRAFHSGTRVVVSSLEVKGEPKEPVVTARLEVLEGPEGTVPGAHLACSDLDRALAYGELQSPYGPDARAEAMRVLKEAKELLDLGVYTQEQYEAEKTRQTPVITHAEDFEPRKVEGFVPPPLPKPSRPSRPAPKPAPVGPKVLDVSYVVQLARGTEGYDAVTAVREALDRHSGALERCYEEPGVATVKALVRPSGKLDKLEVSGQQSACVRQVVAGAKPGTVDWGTRVTVKVEARWTR